MACSQQDHHLAAVVLRLASSYPAVGLAVGPEEDPVVEGLREEFETWDRELRRSTRRRRRKLPIQGHLVDHPSGGHRAAVLEVAPEVAVHRTG